MPADSPFAAAGLLLACLRRDLQIALTYRLAFGLRFVGTLFQVLVFYFISRLVGIGGHPALAPYGGHYFGYVLIGLAFLRLFTISLSGYAAGVSEAQQTGTLEVQALLPVGLPWLVAGGSLWPYLYATGETMLYLALGIVLGAPLAGGNLVGALLAAVLACLAISGLGFMGAGLILVFKRGNAVAWVVEASAALLAGAYFPPELLPPPFQALSLLLPHTHALQALRAALLQGHSTAALLPTLAVLAIFAAILLPAGILALQWAYRQAQLRGSLAQY